MPPFFAPFIGSEIIPVTAEKTFESIDFVPWAIPEATFEGAFDLDREFCFCLNTKSGVASIPSPIYLSFNIKIELPFLERRRRLG